jgi:ankyrin repeat protein
VKRSLIIYISVVILWKLLYASGDLMINLKPSPEMNYFEYVNSKKIVLLFTDKMIDKKELHKEIKPDFIKIFPEIMATYYWENENEFVIKIEEDIKFNENYLIKILKGMKSINGYELREDVLFNFKVISLKDTFLAACKEGDYHLLDELFKLPNFFNVVKDVYKEALIESVKSGQSQMVNFLLSKIEVMHFRDDEGRTLLMLLLADKRYDEAMSLIENKIEIYEKDKCGQNALFYAIDELKIFNKLIDSGLDYNVVNCEGINLIMKASMEGRIDIVKELVRRKADLNHRDYEGRTAIFYAFEKNFIDIVEMLAKSGADLNIEDNNGLTLISLAAYEGKADMIELLIKYGANVNYKNKRNLSVIGQMIMDEIPYNYEMANYIIDKNFDINSIEAYGVPLLLACIKYDRHELAYRLIEKGANVNMKDKDGVTPLLKAVQQKRVELVKLLLDKGAIVEEGDYYGLDALNLAFNSDQIEVMKLLLYKINNVNLLIGPNLITPLMWASWAGDIDLVKLLIEKGSDVNYKNINGLTPLMEAAKMGQKEVVEYLINKGARVNEVSKKGWSALMWAVDRNKPEVVKLLIEKGADVNIKDIDGNTAISIAKIKKNEQLISLLSKYSED